MQFTTKLPPRACPCDLGLEYAACCGRYHHAASQWATMPNSQVEAAHIEAAPREAAPIEAAQGAPGLAPTPESLMRSRYSAYVLRLPGYLMFTWHPSTQPGDMDIPPLKWLGLQVLQSEAHGDAGVVEFIAKFKEHGKAGEMHETSRFVRHEGRWTYIDAAIS